MAHQLLRALGKRQKRMMLRRVEPMKALGLDTECQSPQGPSGRETSLEQRTTLRRCST
eukprot:CAMPEP_0202108618 /NCGR_PEP_ID=MMETSP0965-20130614/21383_1 /ASSEMBLY_ACC=CAM_ASM_000507 /TAXON_ID=4773 /ORGANISM="Schizochytrium aggregatum, Strain ATCC28209" /LENGTH=57 /DNA_ID=CAMNT_0048677881 /DNA_START=255 /DNA_END=424 /DNA_ORIENTATION=-